MKIKDISDFVGGQVLSRVEAKVQTDNKCGSIKVLVPKSIKNGEINHNDLYQIDLKTDIDINKLTRSGDIVVKLSQPYDAAYVTDKDEGLLVTSYCGIIRNISKNVNPKYLLAFINSDYYKEQAMLFNSGALVPMLTKGKIEQIELSIPSIDKQFLIINEDESIKEKEKLFNEIIRLEKLKLENFLRGEFDEQ